MREIDDIYPEYAEAKEPRRKGKHYKGLSWLFFAAATVFVTTVFALNAPPDERTLPPVKKAVTVTVNVADHEEEYKGEEYVYTPEYTYTATDGDKDVSGAVTVAPAKDLGLTVKDAGTYPYGLSASSFDITSSEYDDITVVVNDGELMIVPAEVTVSVKGNDLTVVYDRRLHSIEGYELSFSNDTYKESYIAFSGNAAVSGTQAGMTYMGLRAAQFTNTNDNYDVHFEVTDGYLQINRANVTVNIVGRNETLAYDGKTHTVEGYSVDISNASYTQDLFVFDGTAAAERTEAGTTVMELVSSQFRNLDPNFNVVFNVTDGFVCITGNETIEDPDEPIFLNIQAEGNVNMDMVAFAAISFEMDPNAISKSGGKATARLFVRNDAGTYEDGTEFGSYEYEGDGSDTKQYGVVYYRFPEDQWLVHKKIKLVVDYTYSDGSKGKYESKVYDVYKGCFVMVNYDYGDWGVLLSDDKAEVDLIFMENVEFDNGETMHISYEDVEFEHNYFDKRIWDENDQFVEAEEREAPDIIETFTDDEGFTHIHLTYLFPDGVYPDDPDYSVDCSFQYTFKDKRSGWTGPVPMW